MYSVAYNSCNNNVDRHKNDVDSRKKKQNKQSFLKTLLCKEMHLECLMKRKRCVLDMKFTIVSHQSNTIFLKPLESPLINFKLKLKLPTFLISSLYNTLVSKLAQLFHYMTLQ